MTVCVGDRIAYVIYRHLRKPEVHKEFVAMGEKARYISHVDVFAGSSLKLIW